MSEQTERHFGEIGRSSRTGCAGGKNAILTDPGQRLAKAGPAQYARHILKPLMEQREMPYPLLTRMVIVGAALAMLGGCAALTADDPREATRALLEEAAEGEHRSAENRERNRYRNPVDTLMFFGLEPDMTVVELWPGGGWYTEVLAPVLHERGQLVAANFDTDSDVEYQAEMGKNYLEKLAANAEVYGNVTTRPFDPPRKSTLGDPESADMVVTFRNLHGWIQNDAEEAIFRAVHDVLRSGGIFGVVQHRAPQGTDPEAMAEQGYVPEEYVIELAQRSGFRLAERSEINANPDDTANHPRGVWTLPPTLALGDEDREKYLEIGESDRMTLKFVKE